MAAGGEGDPLVGVLLEGGYRVDELLAVGAGRGRLYRLTHPRRRETLCAKVYDADGGDEVADELRARASAVDALGLPGVAPTIEVGVAPHQRPFLVRALLAGDDLVTRLGSGPLPPAAAATIARALLATLAGAHRAGLAHLHVHGRNVLAPAGPRRPVMLLDFEAAVVDAEAERTARRPTGIAPPPRISGAEHLAPERWDGGGDARADVYAVGSLLHTMIVGTPPFAAPTLMGIARRALTEPAPPLVGAPPALAAAVARALAKDPTERFPDAGTMLAALGPPA